MDGRTSKDATATTLVAAALEGTLTDAQAEQLAALDPVLQKLAWLAAAQRIAELLNGPRIDPATPSGQRWNAPHLWFSCYERTIVLSFAPLSGGVGRSVAEPGAIQPVENVAQASKPVS